MDRELVVRAREGDRDAFAQLVTTAQRSMPGPNGRTTACTSRSSAPPRGNHGYLFVANANGSNARQLDSRLIGWSPHCWTPDDRAIIAPTAEQNVSLGDEPNPGFVVVDVAGTGTETFIATPDRIGFAACSWQRLAPDPS